VQPENAIGLRTTLLHYGLLTLLSATIVAMLSSVGIILSIAFLIAPGAIAFLLTRRFAGSDRHLRQLPHRQRTRADHGAGA
jgi:ABC-type Mn2+/Zn2+ transport system permease subunit